jgi:hypothetical protein
MSLIQSGKTFNDGEQLTAAKLNQMFSDATLSTSGVDGTSIIVNANDVLAVRSVNSARIDTGAVITDKLPDSTVTATDGTPDGVTFPKIQHIETDKILGRITTGDGIVETIGLNTDDEMASASATTLATDGSIKAYVDGTTVVTAPTLDNDSYPSQVLTGSGTANLGGFVLKFGRFELATDDALTLDFPEAFPNDCMFVTVVETRGTGATGGYGLSVPIFGMTKDGFTVNRYNQTDSKVGVSFFAMGN